MKLRNPCGDGEPEVRKNKLGQRETRQGSRTSARNLWLDLAIQLPLHSTERWLASNGPRRRHLSRKSMSGDSPWNGTGCD